MVDDSLINQQLSEELETLWETSIDCWMEYQRPDSSHVEYVSQRTASLIESFNRIRKILNGKIVDKKSPVVCPRCLWLSKSYRHCENCGKHINTKEVE